MIAGFGHTPPKKPIDPLNLPLPLWNALRQAMPDPKPTRVRVTLKGAEPFEGTVVEVRPNSYMVQPDGREMPIGHFGKSVCEVIEQNPPQ